MSRTVLCHSSPPRKSFDVRTIDFRHAHNDVGFEGPVLLRDTPLEVHHESFAESFDFRTTFESRAEGPERAPGGRSGKGSGARFKLPGRSYRWQGGPRRLRTPPGNGEFEGSRISPTPVTNVHLEFERDIVEIQTQIDKLLDLADRKGIDVSDEVNVLRQKLSDLKRETYDTLKPI
jgi:hypothetical protein